MRLLNNTPLIFGVSFINNMIVNVRTPVDRRRQRAQTTGRTTERQTVRRPVTVVVVLRACVRTSTGGRELLMDGRGRARSFGGKGMGGRPAATERHTGRAR